MGCGGFHQKRDKHHRSKNKPVHGEHDTASQPGKGKAAGQQGTAPTLKEPTYLTADASPANGGHPEDSSARSAVYGSNGKLS
jgi:hypothetical protein